MGMAGQFPTYLRAEQQPLALRELELVDMVRIVRRKSDWRRKLAEPAIAERWAAEFRAAGADERAVSYVMAELRWLAEQPIHAEPGEVDGTWQSDALVPPALKADLQRLVRPLENAPVKDFHPGSDGRVLDLVHPSLFPLIFGVSRAVPGGYADWRAAMGGGEVVPRPPLEHKRGDRQRDVSRDYQWLPSEFDVDSQGAVRIASYINNLHPDDHGALYGVIAEVFARMVPLFERVLGALLSPAAPRIEVDCDWYEPVPPELEDDDLAHDFDNLVLKLPPYPDFAPPSQPAPFSLRGRRLQVARRSSCPFSRAGANGR
jgi:hypothetical protein